MAVASDLVAPLAFRHRHRWAADSRIVDGLLVLALTIWYAGLAVQQLAPMADTSPVTTVLLGSAQILPLLWRRSRPWSVFGAVAVMAVTTRWLGGDPSTPQAIVFLALATHAIGRHRSALPHGPCAVVSAAAVMAVPELLGAWSVLPLPHPTQILAIDLATFLLVFVTAWLLGDGQRRNRQALYRLSRLSEQLRMQQELGAHQAMVAERARIARDLHDVVAHHVSAIALRARCVEGSPEIAETADLALTELRRTVGLLADERDDGCGPEPSLANLGRLVRSAEAAGCRVSTTVHGDIRQLSTAVHICASRIIQESLTNVIKHAGPTDVTLVLRRELGTLRLELTNGPPSGTAPIAAAGGFGLMGMREPAALVGGSLAAGPTSVGGWHVAAVLPEGG